MEFKTMSGEQLEARLLEIRALVDNDDADLDALTEEVRSINAELDSRAADQEKRAALLDLVGEQNVGTTEETIEKEERKEMPTFEEIRASHEYNVAYANYVKNGNANECRALLSTNAQNGEVPVPQYLEERIRTAWEKSDLFSLVHRTNLRGNVATYFELSATGASVHEEGAAAPDEEVITFGIVQMIPVAIKKWITVSDEALTLAGEEFLDYLYDEITYRIVRKAEEGLIDMIGSAPTASTSTAASVAEVADALSLSTVVEALGALSGEARDLTILMNRGTFAAIRALQFGANYLFDPFEGIKIVFTADLPNYADAQSGDMYMIIGDFGRGIQANFPDGYGVKILRDDYSLAERDLVKFVGKEMVGMGVVAPNALVRVVTE